MTEAPKAIVKDSEERFAAEYFERTNDRAIWVGWVKKIKREKVQDRLIAVGSYRLISVKRNVRGKKSLQREGHLLTLKEIKFSKARGEVILIWSDFFIDFTSEHGQDILDAILSSRAKICVGMEPLSIVRKKGEDPMVETLDSGDDVGTSFVAVYRAWCNYFEKKPSPEFEMLVENTLLSPTHSRELVLTACPGIELKTDFTFDLQPIFMALQYDKWFRSVELDAVPRKETVALAAQTLLTNRTITRLVLRGTESVEGYTAIGDALRRNGGNQLCELDLGGNAMGDKGLKGIADGLTALNHGMSSLEVSGNHASGRGMVTLVRALMTNVNVQYTLQRLDLSDAKFDSACNEQLSIFLTNLKDAGNLRHLAVRNTGLSIASLCEALRLGVIETLESLDVSSNRVDSPKELLSFAHSSPRLSMLKVDNCKLAPEVLAGLLSALADNKKLKSGMDIYADMNELGPQGASKLATQCVALTNVRKLSLRHCGMGAEGVSKVLEGIAAAAPVEVLDLSCNVKGSSGRKAIDAVLKALANVVQTVAALKVVVLQGDGKQFFLGADGERLMEAVNESRVVELDLSHNKMGDVAAKNVAEALRKNTALRYIALDGNGFSAGALAALKNTLAQHNTTLRGCAPFTADLDALRSSPKVFDKAAETARECSELLAKAAQADPKFPADCHLLNLGARAAPPERAPAAVEIKKGKKGAKKPRRRPRPSQYEGSAEEPDTAPAQPLGRAPMSNRAVASSYGTPAGGPRAAPTPASPRGTMPSRPPPGNRLSVARPSPNPSSNPSSSPSPSPNPSPSPGAGAATGFRKPPPPTGKGSSRNAAPALPAMPGRRVSNAAEVKVAPKLEDEDEGPPLPPRPEGEDEEDDDEDIDPEYDEEDVDPEYFEEEDEYYE